MRKVAITTTTFGDYNDEPLNALKKNGFDVALNPYRRKLKKEEVVELCSDVVGIIAGTETLDGEVMAKLGNLRIISRCGAGLDNIDRETARKKGIRIFSTPDAPTLAVAELTVGLILNLLRRIGAMDAAVKKGRWEKLTGNLVYGKKVGIIGFGRIGKKVGEILFNFGAEVVYCDIEPKTCSFKCGKKSLKKILGWANIITLHLSPAHGCGHIIGKEELGLMKRESFLINTSRGEIVDEDALYQALKEGRLAGAALDVFEHEPYKGPLTELENVILTPHIGSYAKEARIEMEKEAVKNLLKGLKDPKKGDRL